MKTITDKQIETIIQVIYQTNIPASQFDALRKLFTELPEVVTKVPEVVEEK